MYLGQSRFFLKSQADVEWESEDPQEGGEDWFQLYFPKNELLLLSAKQKKHQSHPFSEVSKCILNGILLFLYATNFCV